VQWVFIISLLVLAVFCFFGWANRQTKRQNAAFTKSDVIAAIENVLSDSYHDEWDLFLAWPIADSYLESVRQRCLAISSEYSDREKGKDIATAGEIKLHLILDELKGRT
jgi:hypothetical protein